MYPVRKGQKKVPRQHKVPKYEQEGVESLAARYGPSPCDQQWEVEQAQRQRRARLRDCDLCDYLTFRVHLEAAPSDHE